MPQTLFIFGDTELDLERYELRRNGCVLKLERIPMDLLILLVQRHGQLVTREVIINGLWGQDVFVDTTHGINTAIRKIRQVLCDDPDSPRFVETVVGRGYRFIALVTVEKDAPLRQSSSPIKALELGRQWKFAFSVLAVSLSVVLIVIAIPRFLKSRTSTVAHKVTLVVLPFENLSGDDQQDFFSDGITEQVTTRLGQSDPDLLGIIGRTTAMQYKQSHKTLGQIGKELRVDYVIEGAVQRDGTRAHITVKLIQLSDQTHLWAQTYDRGLDDALSLESDVAFDIAKQIRTKLNTAEKLRPIETRKINPAAYEESLKGRYYLRHWLDREDALDKAREHFERAIELDPADAQAYSGLADLFIIQTFGRGRPHDNMPKAENLANQALRLNEGLAEAHNTLAAIRLRYYWDWPGAEREVKRAIELNPSLPEAYSTYADYFLSLGKLEENLAQNRAGSALDPLYTEMNLYVGASLCALKRYDEAIKEYRQILELEPRSANAHMYIGEVYEAQGRFKEAEEEMRTAYILDGQEELAEVLAQTYRSSGFRAAVAAVCRKRIQRLDQRVARGIYVDPMTYAHAFLGVGDKVHAAEWIEKAYEERSPNLVMLNAPDLRAEFGKELWYPEMLRRIGFPGPVRFNLQLMSSGTERKNTSISKLP